MAETDLTPQEVAADTRLPLYNAGAYDPVTNQYGFDEDGHTVNQMRQAADVGIIGRLVQRLALFARTQAALTAEDASNTRLDRIATAQDRAAAAGSAANALAEANRAMGYANGLNLPPISAAQQGQTLVVSPTGTWIIGPSNPADGSVTLAKLSASFFTQLAASSGFATALDTPASTVKVGDFVLSRRKTIQNYLRADGAKYLKSAYPALASLISKPYPFDALTSVSGLPNSNNPAIGVSAISGDVVAFGQAGDLVIHNFATGATISYTASEIALNGTVCVGIVFGADGFIYVMYALNTTTYIRRFQADVKGAIVAISHNMPSGACAGFMQVNGFWYVRHSDGMYRGASLTALATVTVGSTMVAEIVQFSGNTLVAVDYSGVYYTSTNNGASWTARPIPYPINPALGAAETSWGTGYDNAFRAGLAFYRWKGKLYLKNKGNSTNNSASNWGYLYRIDIANTPTLIGNKRYMAEPGTQNGGYYEFSDSLIVGSPQQSALFRIDEDGELSDGVTYYNSVLAPVSGVFSPPNYSAAQGSGILHPLYGAAARNTTVLSKLLASHNKDTEFRVPNVGDPALDSKYFMRAA